MTETPSPPTARALDIIELLAKQQGAAMSLSDVARQLEQNVSTAKAILLTLCERGWAIRDQDKSFLLGPALAQTAMHNAAARPLATGAHDTARALAVSSGYMTSISERAGGNLVFTVYGNNGGEVLISGAGERIPYTAPFGPAFAAWDTPDERSAWIERSTSSDSALARRIEEMVAATRERGYSVERMSPSLVQATQVMGALQRDILAQSLDSIIEKLLVEITTIGYSSDVGSDGRALPINAMAAPVFDNRGRVRLNLAVHPLRPLTARQIDALGRRLTRLSGEVSARSTMRVAP